jgi:hypothetical protein
LVPGDGAFVRPLEDSARAGGAQALRVRLNAHASKVKAISIPAGLYGRIPFHGPVAMQCAGLEQKFEPSIVQVHQLTTQ